MTSIFTRIINREIPAKFVHEDDVCCAIHDINPQAPVHVVIFPKKEIRSLADIQKGDETILGHLLMVTSKIATQLGVDKNGFRTIINTNGDGGQTVYHIHVHLLAGRTMHWPPG